MTVEQFNANSRYGKFTEPVRPRIRVRRLYSKKASATILGVTLLIVPAWLVMNGLIPMGYMIYDECIYSVKRVN